MVKSKAAPKSYFTHVKALLEHWDDPTWLGANSPLATPYFLGEQLHGTATTATSRGEVLQNEIDRTLQTLWRGHLPTDAATMMAMVDDEIAEHERGERYDCLILELNYLKRIFRPAPQSQSEIYNDILHISRPTHDRHLAQAVERLGTLLLQRLRPAIRPEQPQSVPTLIGREQLQADLLAALQAGRSVSLIGPGGVGKSTLGAALTEAWSSPAIFWFTFRATFNDQIDSLLFALGYFLHTQGASTLWHQLVADGGRLQDGTLALGLLRTDLAALHQQPLLCFDELDVLRPATADQPNPRHVQLLELLDSLRGQTALLLIGQRAFWESDELFAVDGLSEPQVAALLTSFAIPYKREDVARLHYYSGGNPRIVTLCAALYAQEAHTQDVTDSFQQVIDQLPASPTLLPLWHRLARRLLPVERGLLHALAVFRSPAPVDVWQSGTADEAAALAQLRTRRLVSVDVQGGLMLLPALREVIYAELPVELREQYHAQAAQIRAERGEYTAAAHHLHLADQAEGAIMLWYAHQAAEINRGQASSALAIFEEISLRRVDAKTQKVLRLIRAELYQLLGKPEAVVATLEPIVWSPEETAQVDAALLLGKALERQGQTDLAHSTYATAVNTAVTLLRKSTELHFQRGLLYIHERDLGQAWREAKHARYLAESITGTVHEQTGDLAAALASYTAALATAQELHDQSAVAKTFLNLGNIAMRQQAIDNAVDYYTQAMTTHETIGDRVAVEIARSGLAATYMQASRYADAIHAAKSALRFFQAMGHTFWTAINASNLAEAYTELNELDAAETQAQVVLEQEEPQSHPYALFTLGRVRLKQQRLQEAALYMDQARAVANMNGDRFLLAYCWEELGKIQQALGDSAASEQAFGQAHSSFVQLGIHNKAQEIAERLPAHDA